MKKGTIITILSVLVLCLIAVILYGKFKEENMGNVTTDDTEIVVSGLDVFTKEMDSKAKLVSKYETDDGLVTTYIYDSYKIEITNFEGGADSNAIKIYNSNKVVYTNEDVKTLLLDDDTYVVDDLEVKPIIVDGDLYFLSYNANACSDKSDEESLYYLDFNSIDLTNSTIKVNNISKHLLHVEGSVPDCD